LVDVDGVLVWDHHVIPGAVEALSALSGFGNVLFLSNNSSLSQAGFAHKLQALGFDATQQNVLGSAALAARYLTQHTPHANVFVVGHDGLREELTLAGHTLSESDAQWMITGMDRELDYEKLATGLRLMTGGARWVAANADGTYRSREGLKPGAGCVVGAFRGMGFEPEKIVGKPSAYCMSQALEKLQVDQPNHVLVIGDRLDSDIEGARSIGADSALVLSGVTSESELSASVIQPTYSFPDIASLVGASANAL